MERMSQQLPQSSRPTFINLPPPSSNPDTPSEIPGTPTSTTTSLSALSTTAIKDGHRGALHHRGHQHSPSANSLEAERADRISRLAGLSNVSMLRDPPAGPSQHNVNSPQTTPTSVGFPANPTAAAAAGGLTPAYFDATGQPVAATKVSTVGSASATESVAGRTTTTTEMGGDRDTLAEERDEDMLTEMDSASASGYMGADAMDEDLDNLTSRSAGGVEDRMSDDGSASLVGFGEGAGSTVSGPIYQRRPMPLQGGSSAAGAGAGAGAGAPAPASWGLEHSSSGLGDGATASPNPHHSSGGGGSGRRDFAVPRLLERDSGGDTPISQSAVRERREARMVDGVALDTATPATTTTTTTTDPAAAPDDDVFVDTTNRGPVPVPRTPTTSTTRERLRRHQQPTQPPAPAPSTASSSREAAERIIRERLDEGEGRVGATTLRSPRGGERLGRFYFEDR